MNESGEVDDILVRQCVDPGLLMTKWRQRNNGTYTLSLGNVLVAIYHHSGIHGGFAAKDQVERIPPSYFDTEKECIEYCEGRLNLFVERLQGVKE